MQSIKEHIEMAKDFQTLTALQAFVTYKQEHDGLYVSMTDVLIQQFKEMAKAASSGQHDISSPGDLLLEVANGFEKLNETSKKFMSLDIAIIEALDARLATMKN